MSFGQREELLGDDIHMSHTSQWVDASDDEGENEALHTLPPGEEGMLLSHAGQDATFQQVMQGVRPGRGDLRLRSDRVQKVVNSWTRQLPALVDAYFEFQTNGARTSADVAASWSIPVLGFDERGLHPFSYSAPEQTANVALILHGYIGSAPDQPGLAFPLRLFEIYRQLHRACPRFSLDALSKVLTNLHEGPRKSALHDQLGIAYDAYLAILRAADVRVQKALGRSETWYMDNVCPPCLYKVENEPPLRFSWLGAMDGNNSLKLVDPAFHSGAPRLDNRTSALDRWLSPQEVDEFKDEVFESQKRPRGTGPILTKTHTSATATLTEAAPTSASVTASPTPTPVPSPAAGSTGGDVPAPDQEDDIAWLNVNELDAMQAEELAKCTNACVDRWRNAGPEQRKKMFALFAVAGIFLVVCRHGHVVVMCDMIRSGELMKYPLAMVKRLLDRYGKDIGLGYDIMCAFFKTLLRSSLGSRVVAMNLRGVVPAFHGHAHNRACQIGWHPLYVDGVGLEDFEECERTFAKSNHLASTTRLTTSFHRKQAIDEHFYFHDLDKHASSGNFIYQNYRQGVEKAAINRIHLDALEQRLGTTGADYEAALVQEQEYFQGLRSEPKEVATTVEYMDLLIKLYARSEAAEAAKAARARLDRDIIENGFQRPEILRVQTRYRTTFEMYLNTHEEVCRHEELHGIANRWTPTSKEYKEALVMMTERRYKQAVTELERVVVGRLFEMTKLGMSGVAYKLREKLMAALKTRSEAIRKAIERYNTAAMALDPPRPRLTWRTVIDSASLAEFDWLRETRQDIRQLPWAQPARREAMVLYFGIKRSEEEKVRLNVEIRRLITSMYDEHIDFYRAIAANLIVNPPLVAHALSRLWEARTRINTSIAKRLLQTSRLPGFTGTLFPGAREGRDASLRDGVPPPPWLVAELGLTTVEVEYEEEEEDSDMSPAQRREYDASGLAREADFDNNLVIELMETLTTADDT
ncbi:hypothetical protein C8F04DRAFT_1266771 [Mycena alexandri]|uniref:CxC1-like cysteine cluster associated with KDZ transposases domain-containing protein n=1 Tax=Mycena alexandri TaxID=1745969 RepID=A0AAD6WWB2_9AGAR|nr:hypothetical protein C8F04DRAFT_1266771 [Mycena alexandri]